MAVVEAGFQESLSLALKGSQFGKYFPMTGTTERGDKGHFFKEINFNQFADRLWQVVDLLFVALCFGLGV